MKEQFEGFNEEQQTSAEQGQLLEILDNIKADPKIYSEISQQLAERMPDKFASVAEVQQYFESVVTSTDALGIARLIDESFGEGTFRTLSFLDKKQDTAKNVYKLLRNSIDRTSFEKQVENGQYLNLLESYGVQWDLEKVSRDSLQNFFDANGQTLDGIDINTSFEKVSELGKETKIGRVRIQAPQDYDWRELVHFGGTTKQDSETSAGGFGEGLKIAAFTLLRDQGASEVKAASRDWELNYSFDDIPADAYRKKVRGLFAKKHKREERPGNYLEITFQGDDADKKVKMFEQAQELFFSSKNPDFQGASFDNKDSGGFKVLPPIENPKYSWNSNQKGHLYLAGQRSHFNNRDKWETVDDINIWTWKKVTPKDRDRGMITGTEMKGNVMPLIVESMSIEDLKKSVYDFKPLWDKFSFFSTGSELLERVVSKLEKEGVKLEFENEYLANNSSGVKWIGELLKKQGFKLCPPYMNKVGMKGVIEQFKELQSHYRVEAMEGENQKINLLQDAGRKLGLTEDEVKEIWIFSAESEKNIIHGQYNPEFYWLAREVFSKSFLDALHVYVHESAHKEGPHGDAKFEYRLQEQIKKIQQFILEHKDEWDILEGQWNSTNEKVKEEDTKTRKRWFR